MPVERQDRRKSPYNRLAGVILAVAILYFGREVFIPLALAGLLAFLLAPIATRLERTGLPRTPAVLLVITLSLAAVSALGWVVLGQIYNLAVELPQYQQNISGKIESLHLHSSGKLTGTVEMLTELSRELSEANSSTPAPALARRVPVLPRRGKATPIEPALGSQASHDPIQPVAVRVEEGSSTVLGVAGHSLVPLIHPLTTTFIILIFVIFILLARDDLRDRAIRLAGSSRMHITTVAMSDASRRVSRYLLMQFVVNVTYGGVVGFALWAAGLPHPLLWAVLTCLLRFIPYIGILTAAAGPLLIAVAVSPHWSTVIWTFVVFVVLELVAANGVEPFLYGASTGVSALAILVAAIFWTWLWGLAGLLLSTPLTVCLIVIGRHFPPLDFIGVLFGEDTALAPPERVYQRMLAADSGSAAKVVEKLLETKSREDVYDSVLLPTLALVEEARHTEEIDGSSAERILQGIEELAEEIGGRPASAKASLPSRRSRQPRAILCASARDFADEIAGQLLLQVAADGYRGRVLNADLSTGDLLDIVASEKPDVVCVVGVPPQAVRHVRLRCHQLRTRFPNLVVVAGVLSVECDLPNIRSRIPMEDAQHVVCSLAQAREYLRALADPADAVLEASATKAESGQSPPEVTQPIEDLRGLDIMDPAEEKIFSRIAASLAKSFEAPIALINPLNGERTFWRSQCGLPDDAATEGPSSRDLSLCSQPIRDKARLVVPDIYEDALLSHDEFLKEKGIRFFAGTPLLTQEGIEIGCLCVLDSRPRNISEQQKEILTTMANSVMNAIEIRSSRQIVEFASTSSM